MAQNGRVFARKEIKYLLSDAQRAALQERLTPYMQSDAHGQYTICNLYYDTDDYQLIRHSIAKPVYKEKFRLRSYGTPGAEDEIFLEIKKKYKGVVYKRRERMPYAQAQAFLNGERGQGSESQILREISYFLEHYQPRPKVYLAYDRIALSGKEDAGLRITFDRNIRSRFVDLRLDAGDHGASLLADDQWLMEIKADGAMPLWLVEALTALHIYPVSFSKYGKIYEAMLEGGEETCSTAS